MKMCFEMEKRTKIVRDIRLTCIVLHYILRRHQEAYPQNRQDNLPTMNDSKRCRAEQNLLTEYFTHFGALSGQDENI